MWEMETMRPIMLESLSFRALISSWRALIWDLIADRESSRVFTRVSRASMRELISETLVLMVEFKSLIFESILPEIVPSYFPVNIQIKLDLIILV